MRRLLIVLLSLIIALTIASPVWADTSYVVQPGDTLTKIAVRFNVTVETLARANHLDDPNALRVGQTLTIPDGATQAAPAGSATYIVQSGDSLARIAARFHITVEALMAANGLTTTTIQVGQALVIPAPVEAPPSSIYDRVQGSAGFVRRIHAALDWLQTHDPEAYQRVDTYITIITPSRYAHLAQAHPLPDGGCAVRALARQDMSVKMTVAMLYHEATHCYHFATAGWPTSKEAEVFAYSEQIAFMERHGFPEEVLEYYRRVLAYYASQPDDGRYIPPPDF